LVEEYQSEDQLVEEYQMEDQLNEEYQSVVEQRCHLYLEDVDQ